MLIEYVLDIGVCVINVLLIVGCGQCMGFFVGFGVGKLVLFGMMVCYIWVDVIIVGFIGECGCEVKDFIENIFGFDGCVCLVVIVVLVDVLLLL